jgi:alanine racemase
VPIAASGIGGRGAEVFVAGARCPLVGRISMDLSIADVTDLPAGAVAVGSLVEWLGPHVGVDALAARCGTIGYEILVNLGRRHRRHYIGDGTGAA